MLDTTLTNEILTAHVTNSVLHTAAHSATLSRLFAALSEHTDADAFTAAALVVHWPRRVICSDTCSSTSAHYWRIACCMVLAIAGVQDTTEPSVALVCAPCINYADCTIL
jgi:hypothetical protein